MPGSNKSGEHQLKKDVFYPIWKVAPLSDGTEDLLVGEIIASLQPCLYPGSTPINVLPLTGLVRSNWRRFLPNIITDSFSASEVSFDLIRKQKSLVFHKCEKLYLFYFHRKVPWPFSLISSLGLFHKQIYLDIFIWETFDSWTWLKWSFILIPTYLGEGPTKTPVPINVFWIYMFEPEITISKIAISASKGNHYIVTDKTEWLLTL